MFKCESNPERIKGGHCKNKENLQTHRFELSTDNEDCHSRSWTCEVNVKEYIREYILYLNFDYENRSIVPKSELL